LSADKNAERRAKCSLFFFFPIFNEHGNKLTNFSEHKYMILRSFT